MRSLWTPTVLTASNFHSARRFSGFSLTQRLVCHLCHKHCGQQRIGVVHVCWLATPACGETSLVIECAASYLNNIKLCSSAFAPPSHCRFVFKDQLPVFAWQKISRLWSYPQKCWTFQSCYWLCLLHLLALPQTTCDFTVMLFLITWKFPVRAQPRVPKMAGAHSVWSFNTFFFFIFSHFTVRASQPALKAQLVHSWLPAPLSVQFFAHKGCFFFFFTAS